MDGPVGFGSDSHGGVIITEAGADEQVTPLLYITSVMSDAEPVCGGSLHC